MVDWGYSTGFWMKGKLKAGQMGTGEKLSFKLYWNNVNQRAKLTPHQRPILTPLKFKKISIPALQSPTLVTCFNDVAMVG